MNAVDNSDLINHAREQLEKEKSLANRPCKVCGGQSKLFDIVDFYKFCNFNYQKPTQIKVPVCYRRCVNCDFISTYFFDEIRPDQWISWVYNEEYYQLIDPEYSESRPMANARVINNFCYNQKEELIGLDYGGGNGRVAYTLRGWGYDYSCYDPFGYSEPEFKQGDYNFCSLFEVAEHSQNPKSMLKDVLGLCSKGRLIILIGTQLHENNVSDESKLAWWYAAPRNGHVSLFSRKSLKILAVQYGLDYFSFGSQMHLMTRGVTKLDSVIFLISGKFRTLLSRIKA